MRPSFLCHVYFSKFRISRRVATVGRRALRGCWRCKPAWPLPVSPLGRYLPGFGRFVEAFLARLRKSPGSRPFAATVGGLDALWGFSGSAGPVTWKRQSRRHLFGNFKHLHIGFLQCLGADNGLKAAPAGSRSQGELTRPQELSERRCWALKSYRKRSAADALSFMRKYTMSWSIVIRKIDQKVINSRKERNRVKGVSKRSLLAVKGPTRRSQQDGHGAHDCHAKGQDDHRSCGTRRCAAGASCARRSGLGYR